MEQMTEDDLPGTLIAAVLGTEITVVPGTYITVVPGTEVTALPGTVLLTSPAMADEGAAGQASTMPAPPPPNSPALLPDPPPKKSQEPVALADSTGPAEHQPRSIEERQNSGDDEPVPLTSPILSISRQSTPMVREQASSRNAPKLRVHHSSPRRSLDRAHLREEARKPPPSFRPPRTANEPHISAIDQRSRIAYSWAPSTDLIANPGMGFQRLYRDAWVPGTAYVPIMLGLTPVNTKTIYQRFFWSAIETSPGNYDFSPIERALQLTVDRGMRLALRIEPFWAGADNIQAAQTPLYINSLGASSSPPSSNSSSAARDIVRMPQSWQALQPRRLFNGSGALWQGGTNLSKEVPFMSSDFRDVCIDMIDQLAAFLAPWLEHIDFLDVGLLGETGEWAKPWKYYFLGSTPVLPPDQGAGALPDGWIWEIVDHLISALPHTHLIANGRALYPPGIGFDPTTTPPTPVTGLLAGSPLGDLSGRLGWRNDHWGTEWADPGPLSAQSDFYSASMNFGLNRSTQYCPVVLEIGGSAVSVGQSRDFANAILDNGTYTQTLATRTLNQRVLVNRVVDSALNARASYIYLKSLNLADPNGNHDATVLESLKWLGTHMGYRLYLSEAVLPATWKVGTISAPRPVSITLTFQNHGVARCLAAGYGRRWQLALRLRPTFGLKARPLPAVLFPVYADEFEPSTAHLEQPITVSAAFRFGQQEPSGDFGVRRYVLGTPSTKTLLMPQPAQIGSYYLEVGFVDAANPDRALIQLASEGLLTGNQMGLPFVPFELEENWHAIGPIDIVV